MPGGASGTTFDCAPGTTVSIRSLRSFQGRKGSYRRPYVSVKRGVILNSSCTKNELYVVYAWLSRIPKSRLRLSNAPSIKSATGSPDRTPLNVKPGDPMNTCRKFNSNDS